MVGFIAEEIYDIAPEIVFLDEEGRPDALNYNGIIALLVNAVKELSAKVDALASNGV